MSFLPPNWKELFSWVRDQGLVPTDFYAQDLFVYPDGKIVSLSMVKDADVSKVLWIPTPTSMERVLVNRGFKLTYRRLEKDLVYGKITDKEGALNVEGAGVDEARALFFLLNLMRELAVAPH